MINQRIIFQTEDGGVAIIIPSPDCGLTVDEIAKKDVPEGIPYKIVDVADIPEDRHFRNAWEMDSKSVKVNLAKAKEVTKENLRIDRAPLFQTLDVEFQRAVEKGADTTSIVKEKDRLRDITKLADLAGSLEELRKISI